jgi:hypothetical protein
MRPPGLDLQIQSARRVVLGALGTLLLTALLGVVGTGVASADSCPSGSACLSYTGGEQTYKVPDGVSSIKVTAVGAPGGGGGPGFGGGRSAGGAGATVTEELSVSAGETLYIEIGGPGAAGTGGAFGSGAAGGGGFDGGGAGGGPGGDPTQGTWSGAGGGGGGATTVETGSCGTSCPSAGTLSSRLLVAGGGGGGGGDQLGGPGGNGSQNGEAGTYYASNPSTGGAGGQNSNGEGSTGTVGYPGSGGGGGGGYAGGGGGQGGSGNFGGGGGGGGSSYGPGATFGTASAGTQGSVMITPVNASGYPCGSGATSTCFNSTGAEQQYTVPDGVSTLQVVATSGHGGTGGSTTGNIGAGGGGGGAGATVTSVIAVSPGETLYVEVGGLGGNANGQVGGSGGWNGGGGAASIAGTWYYPPQPQGGPGGGGGGASDVRTVSCGNGCPGTGSALDSRLVVAGGGGGGGGANSDFYPSKGGAGGGCGSQGGDRGSGVAPGGGGTNSSGVGGTGDATNSSNGGGGGGGGYHGGGGGQNGGATSAGSGGGGGSSTGTPGSTYTGCSSTTPGVVVTPEASPTVTTQDATAVSSSSATLHGSVSGLAQPASGFSYHFEYGTDTSYGQVTPTESISASGGSVSADLTGLTPGQTYDFQLVLSAYGGTYDGGDDTVTAAATSSTSVSCSPSPAAGTATTCAAVVTGQDAAASGPPSGNVSFSVSPSSADGNLGSGGTCTLANDGASSTCSVSFAPPGGAYTVTADYQGDGSYPISSDTSPADVTSGWGDDQTLPFSNLKTPQAVASDANGDVFVINDAAPPSQTVVERTPSGKQTTLGFPGTVLSLAVDAAGDVFVVDSPSNQPGVDNVVLELPAGDTASADAVTLSTPGLQAPTAVAADPLGDVFVAGSDPNDPYGAGVLELPAGDTGSASGTMTDFNLDNGAGGTVQQVAVDALGDVFIVAFGNASSQDAVYEAPAGSAGQDQQLSAFSPDTQLGIAVDAAGDLFEVDATGNGSQPTVQELPAGADSALNSGGSNQVQTLATPAGPLQCGGCLGADEQGDVLQTVGNQVQELSPRTLVVSHVRFSGPSGSGDGFVQLTNVAPYAIDLSGWTLAYSGGSITLPSVSVPPNGSYLIAGDEYSLGSDTSADRSPSGLDLSGGWVQLLSPTGATADTVGLSSAPSADRIGSGLPVPANTSTQYAFVRNESAGAPVFTGDNSTEFTLVSASPSGLDGSVLGSPAPQDSSSPVVHNDVLQSGQLTGKPDFSYTPGTGGDPGTLTVYRALTDCTGQPASGACVNELQNTTAASVTRLAFRITGLTTDGHAQSGQAILESENGTVYESGGCASPADPVAMPLDAASTGGGGLNSVWTVPASALPLSSGGCLGVAFTFKVVRTGSFSFAYDTEDDLVRAGTGSTGTAGVSSPGSGSTASAGGSGSPAAPSTGSAAASGPASGAGTLSGVITKSGAVTIHTSTARGTAHKGKKKKATKHKKKATKHKKKATKHKETSASKPKKTRRRHGAQAPPPPHPPGSLR